MGNERQGPTLSVRHIKVSAKRESSVVLRYIHNNFSGPT